MKDILTKIFGIILMISCDYFQISSLYSYQLQILPELLSNTLNKLFKNISNRFRSKTNNTFISYTFDQNTKKKEMTIDSKEIVTTKSLDNLILDKRNKTEIVDDFKKFKQNKSWYENVGIPYKRTYYLYGLPGSGKTSIVKVLAKEYQYEIYSLDYNKFDDEKYLQSLPFRNAIVLIDEFNRNHNAYENINFCNLLKYLDGVEENNNLITFICTNSMDLHLESRNEALFRDGRIDVSSYFDYLSINQFKDIMKFYFKEEYEVKNILKIYPSRLINLIIKGLSPSEIISQIEKMEVEEVIHEDKKVEDPTPVHIPKSIKTQIKLNNMSDEERKIYLKRKELNKQALIICQQKQLKEYKENLANNNH